MTLLNTSLPNLIHRGKVRDTYDLNDGLLLMVATDRISAFDMVLPNGIPSKGIILSRLSGFWFHRTAHLIPNHFLGLADDPEIRSRYSNISLLGSLPPDIASRSMVVKRAQRLDVECIVRGYLAGSAWAEYRRTGTISGVPVQEGLIEGSKLPMPLFTPTTKADIGHDENLSKQQVVHLVGPEIAQKLENTSLALYQYANEYASNRDLILADTKVEFGLINGQLTLIDELFTPDSSRFWDMEAYSPGRPQPNFDKQFVRDWLLSSEWDRESPPPALPEDVVQMTSERYLEASRRLMGTS